MLKEKRKDKRRPLRYNAWVALTAEQRHNCVVSDVSESGARIDVQDSSVIPDHFVLMLTSNGAARRFCRVMWRKPNQIGVQFTRTLAEAAGQSGAPKSDSNTPTAPEAPLAPAVTQTEAAGVEPAKTN